MRWAAAGVSLALLQAGASAPSRFAAQAPVVRRAPSQAQAPQGLDDGELPVIRVQSRLVNVALNVVDAKGAPVGGLGKDDFEISEDGKPQKIAVFERESSTPLSIVMSRWTWLLMLGYSRATRHLWDLPGWAHLRKANRLS